MKPKERWKKEKKENLSILLCIKYMMFTHPQNVLYVRSYRYRYSYAD